MRRVTLESRRSQLVILLAVALVSLVLAQAPSAHAAARTVRVGVYQNEPKVYVDDEGRPAGIFIDLIEAIAAEEGWDLEYV